MADALAPIFHGNPALASNSLKPASFKESWARDAKAIVGIILAGGKTQAIAAAASRLPPNDPLGMFLTKLMVNTLWSSMLHPPLSYRGQKSQYRAADGSGNSVLFPQLGQAGLPYAKTVQATSATHGAKPDPGDLFDMLMARDENTFTKESDLGISSMLLYHADIIIHDIFRTNATDKNISDTSSYLDLSPLYGKDRESQESVRAMEYGLLKPDSFAEDRLLNQPPGVCIYLIMYNRFHNYVAQQLLEINENSRFSQTMPEMPKDWTPSKDLIDRISKENEIIKNIPQANADADKANANIKAGQDAKKLKSKLRQPTNVEDNKAVWKKQFQWKLDEDLFQTARLVTCGLYINISVHDYLRCLMRKHAELTSWTLEPRSEMSVFNKDTIQRGIGNQVTVEFNVLYRFHSPLSERDAAWTKRFLQHRLKKEGLDPDPERPDPQRVTQAQFKNGDIPLQALQKVLKGLYADTDHTDIRKTLPASPRSLRVEDNTKNDSGKPNLFLLERDENTYKFKDYDLVSEMVRAMEDPICQFGAKNVPKFFRSIEILGILQSRKWEMATLNEFREFFKMSRHQSFEDINSDPKIQTNLRNLYEHPDMVELYPGLFCEGQGRCLDPGTTCPNGQSTALWRGVFSDAVTLVRSDRFYTIDWNTDSLTAWGMKEVIPDLGIFKGGVMARLFQRAFPGYFKNNSIHLWQPFYTPAMNSILAYDQKQLDNLQPVEDLGIKRKDFEAIMNLRHESHLLRGRLPTSATRTGDGKPGNPGQKGNLQVFLDKRGYHLSQDDIDDLESTHETLNKAFEKLPFYKKMFKDRTPDADKLLQKLRFKLLRDVVKMNVVRRAPPPILVSNMDTLREHFLKGSEMPMFKNPGYADESAIPKGPLRSVLTQEGELYWKGMRTFQELVTPEWEAKFFRYFVKMSNTIRERQQLDYTYYNAGEIQTAQQIDIIKDYAIPVVTRFTADFLGFGQTIKTAMLTSRPYGENQIYEHFNNCQDYLTFDSDETKAYRRRKAFQDSIKFLLNLTEKGVADARKGWFEFCRSYHMVGGDDESVKDIRKFGVMVAQQLTKTLKGEKEAAAVMLAVALDGIHKSVVMFAEVIQFLLCSDERKHWEAIKKLADSDNQAADKKIARYVLEAQRINLDIPLVRRYIAAEDSQHSDKNPRRLMLVNEKKKLHDMDGHTSLPELHTFSNGDMFLLEVRKASNDESYFHSPEKIILDRPASEQYLIYNPTSEGKFNAKQLTILAITGMIKHAATLSKLREAHDTMGRLKTALVPASGRGAEDSYRKRYLSVRWDELGAFPATWNLRFSGVGPGIADPRDNSRQGHGMGELVQDESLSAEGGSLVSHFK